MRAPSGVVGVGMSLMMVLRRLTGRPLRRLLGRPLRGLVWGLAGPLVRRVRAWRAEPTRAEVLTLLRRHRAELSGAPVQVLAAAEAAGVSRRTLRRWVRRHGVDRLELSLAAGLSDADLRSHLSSNSMPSAWGLEMLAETSGADL